MNLSTIIAGTWRLPERGKTAGEVADWIRRALDLCVDTFDLADIYGGYTVEEAFGDALRLEPGLASRIKLVTKCDIRLVNERRPENTAHIYDTSAAHIVRSVDASLAALGVEEGDADRTLDALRCSHVLLADRTPLDGHPPTLLDPRAPSQEPGPDLASHEGGVRPKLPPISVEAEPLQVWSPGDGVTDARLPLELDNPLIELWRIERPGPRLSLYRRLSAEHRRLPAEQGRQSNEDR